jgi:hypothetical protein
MDLSVLRTVNVLALARYQAVEYAGELPETLLRRIRSCSTHPKSPQ